MRSRVDLRTCPSRCALAAALSGLVACAGDPPAPGFEQVDGEGGAGGAPSSSTSTSASSITSASSSSVSSSAASTSSSSSTGGLDCGEGPSSEPNDTEATARDLGTIGDCDSEGEQISGVLTGFADVDWYKYLGSDKSAFCSVSPARSLVASHPVRLCKFVQCLDGQAPSFSCPSGTSSATSPDGRAGCCGSAGFDFGASCGSFLGSDDLRVYLRVTTEEQACVEYTIDYHF
jgi:hypothetical protein